MNVSREKFRKKVREEMEEMSIAATQEQINDIAERRVRDEIRQGVQIIQYQVITLMTTNGQAPFITVFMYIDEVPEGRTRDDLALIIEEMLNQRICGVKNEKGVYITPAFPKLHGEADGAGLYFRKNNEAVKGWQLLYLYGMPFFPYRIP